MAILGYDSIGGSLNDAANIAGGCKFTAPEDGLITSMLVYMNAGTEGYGAKVAIYSDNSGTPGTLLASATSTIPATPGWTAAIPISLQIASGTVYWLCAKFQATAGPKDVYTTGTTAQYKEWLETYAGSWASPPTINYTAARKFSIYANYSPLAPPDAPSAVSVHSPGAGKGHAVATQAASGNAPTGIRFYKAPDSNGSPDSANKTQLTPDATPPGAGLTVEHEENALAEAAVWWLGASAINAGGESGITWAAAALTIHSAPTLVISDPPGTGYTLSAGTPLLCAAGADDAEDGELDASIEWTDSVEGLVHTGGSFSLDTTGFAEGAHVMTAAVTDSDGDTADDTFGYTIGSAPAGTSGRREPMIVDGITYGEAVTVNAPLYDSDEKTPLTAALSTGDVKISKDGGAKTNIATLPAALNADGVTWPIALSTTEMQAKEIHVYGPAAGSPTPALILRTVGSSGFYDETPVATDGNGAVVASSLGAQASTDVQAAAAAALATYDPPTKAELDSAQAAVIAGVPDSTDVQAAAAAAMTAYDPPTKGELDAALAALNDLDAAAIATAVQTGLTAQGLTSAVVTALKVAALAGGGGKSHRASTAVPLTVYDTDGTTPLGTITITKSGGQLLDMEFTPA